MTSIPPSQCSSQRMLDLIWRTKKASRSMGGSYRRNRVWFQVVMSTFEYQQAISDAHSPSPSQCKKRDHSNHSHGEEQTNHRFDAHHIRCFHYFLTSFGFKPSPSDIGQLSRISQRQHVHVEILRVQPMFRICVRQNSLLGKIVILFLLCHRVAVTSILTRQTSSQIVARFHKFILIFSSQNCFYSHTKSLVQVHT